MFNACLNNTGHGALVDSYHDGTDFYRVYSDGWCEQGGYNNGPWTSSNQTINLLVPFASNDYYIGITVDNIDNVTPEFQQITLGAYTNADFTTNRGGKKKWFACGFIQ